MSPLPHCPLRCSASAVFCIGQADLALGRWAGPLHALPSAVTCCSVFAAGKQASDPRCRRVVWYVLCATSALASVHRVPHFTQQICRASHYGQVACWFHAFAFLDLLLAITSATCSPRALPDGNLNPAFENCSACLLRPGPRQVPG